MKHFDRRTIYTHADGTLIEGRPDGDPPARNAPIGEKIAWVRGWHAYHDHVADVSNRAFADEFMKVVRGQT